MQQLFKRFFVVSEVRRRRRRARIDTSPQSAIDLCRLLQRRGRIKAARDEARAGLGRFPRSRELRELLASTWRRSNGRELAGLQSRVSRDPSVANHLALVAYLSRFGEHRRAVDACRRMTADHPGAPEASLALGRALMACFHRDHVARDGSEGLRHLQAACELDPSDFSAHLELAQTYYCIGAVKTALDSVYAALEIEPDNVEANRLHRVLVRLPVEERMQGELLQEIEENDELRFSHEPRRQPDASSLRRALEQMSMLAGVRRVTLCRQDGDLVAEAGRMRDRCGDRDLAFVESSRAFRRAASLAAKRMGIGAFEEAEMSWDGGALLAFGVGSHVVVISSDGSPQRIATITTAARNFIAGATFAAPCRSQVTHA